MFQARKTLNSRRGLSQFDQLQVARLVNHATWFFIEDHITLVLQIVTNGSCANFLDFFHLFVFQDGIVRYSFHSKIDFEFGLTVNRWNRIPFQCFLELEEAGSSVVLPLTSLFSVPTASSFLELEDAQPESGCCCCCCECQLLLSVTFGVRSPFWEITQKMQSAVTGLCTIIALDYICQIRNPWSCARDKFSPTNGVLITFPMTVIVCFLMSCEIIMRFFFFWIFSERVERCEEDGLSSFLALFSPCSKSVLKDGLDACETQTLSNRQEFKRASSIQAQMLFHQSVPELLENQSRNVWNPRNTRTSSCYFLHGCVEANMFLRNLVLLCPWSVSAISALSCPDELLHQTVVILGYHGAPVFWPFWRSPLKEILLCTMRRQEYFSTFIHRRYRSLCVICWAGRKTDIVRIQFPVARIGGGTSFLGASLRLRQAMFTFFRVFMFRESFLASESMSDTWDM